MALRLRSERSCDSGRGEALVRRDMPVTGMVGKLGWWSFEYWRDYIHRGCRDLSDIEHRRHTALVNISALSGLFVCVVFAAISLWQGNYFLAGVLMVVMGISWLSVWVHHRTGNPFIAAWIGLTTVSMLLLYLLGSGGDQGTGYVWIPIFPLVAMFALGPIRGSVLTGIFFAAAGVILFVPDFPLAVAVYPLALKTRIVVATLFVAVIALFFEQSRKTAHARMRDEIEVRRRVEAELRKAEKTAARASQAKSDFLATLSHEVRTPLTSIVGLNDLLAKTDLDELQQHHVALAGQSGRSLIALMDDILDLSQVEAGKLNLHLVPFDLRTLAETVVRLHGTLAAEKNLDLKLVYDCQAPRQVVGDQGRLRQVLMNLTGNAVKFTAEGHVILTVELERATDTTTTLAISVTDSGVGLSEELQTTVFLAFAQGDTPQKRDGVGLGLAISKRLVEAMGGEIGVRSQVGQGATFWVRLTLGLSDDLSDGVSDDLSDGVSDEGTTPIPTFDAQILLVEDNAVSREVVCAMLEHLGCTVDLATDGEAGVAKFATRTYDLVLMDCQMPVLDGYAASAQMRAGESARQRTPIIAITAYALPEDLHRCLEAGMDDHLTKPLGLEGLAEGLSRWLSVRESRQ